MKEIKLKERLKDQETSQNTNQECGLVERWTPASASMNQGCGRLGVSIRLRSDRPALDIDILA
jgi:hypothetical protein